MKKLFTILGLCLTLAACGGGGADVACESSYWDGTVGTCLPAGWKVVEKAALEERGIPAEVLVAFQSDTPFSGQFPTVTVTREALAQDVSSTDYSEASVQSVKSIPAYEQIDNREITIDEEPVRLHVFSAQPRSEDPKTRFYQVSIAARQTGYTFTAAVPLGIEDEVEEQILLILNNATLKEPAAE